jgi:hypothetical protein
MEYLSGPMKPILNVKTKKEKSPMLLIVHLSIGFHDASTEVPFYFFRLLFSYSF